MGEVWKARDARLDRTVAIKFAKSDFSERFDREARTVAALNHPNICQVYDIGPNYLVMEFLEGTTLKGPLPVEKAVEYAGQILDALDAAHKKGITHRDLKPDNILLTKQGVKLLDFGLAKQSAPLAPNDATLASALTAKGEILGTLQYISPEQLQGREVGARSDIFAFGCVLYEMLSGKRAFDGGSAASVIGAILEREPVPLDLHPPLGRVIQRCLAKDPGDRFQTALDLKFALTMAAGTVAGPGPQSPERRVSRHRAVALVGVTVLLLAGAAWKLRSPFQVPMSPAAWKLSRITALPAAEGSPSFSPDSSQVAFTWRGPEAQSDIYVKVIDADQPVRITTDPKPDVSPKWSPDGRWIAFVRSSSSGIGEVMLVRPTGGGERKVADVKVEAIRADPFLAWMPDSKALVVPSAPGEQRRGLDWIALDTGERRAITHVQAPLLGDTAPSVSATGDKLVFVRTFDDAKWAIYLQRLRNGKPDGDAIPVVDVNGRASSPSFLPSGSEIVFQANYSVLPRGIYRVSLDPPHAPILIHQGEFASPTISRDGNRIAMVEFNYDTDVYRLSLEDGTEQSLLKSSQRDDHPAYSPDGSRIVFHSERSGSAEVWVVGSDGSNPMQITSFGGPDVGLPRWSPDGNWIIFSAALAGRDPYIVSAKGGVPRRLFTHPSTDEPFGFSRDGKWIYVTSKRSGNVEIYRLPFGGGELIPVTTSGGRNMAVSPDGKSLYFRKPPGFFRIPLENGIPAGPEELVTEVPNLRGHFAVSSKGIYFGIPGQREIQFLDLASLRTWVVHTVAPPEILGWGFSVSPDEKSVLFAKQSPSLADILLIENFR